MHDRDVIIVGGGLAGAATVYFLARDGVDVLLLEAGDLNTQASGSNAGSVHLQIPVAEYGSLGRGWAEHFAPTLAVMQAGAELWADLPDMLGQSLEFRQSGGIIAAKTSEEFALVKEKAALEAEHGIEMHFLDQNALRGKAPYLTDRMIGGAFYPDEGKANPLLATRAFAAAAQKEGAEIRPHSRVTALQPLEPGYRVETETDHVTCRRLVNAAGARAGNIAGMLGIDLPIRGFPLQVTATEPTGPLLDHLVYSAAGKLTLKQMANGTCLIGGGWPSTLNPDGTLAANEHSMLANMKTAIDVVPALAQLSVVRTWPAIVNGNDSWRPVVGEVPSHPGFFLNLFPWMGFTAGPICALALSEIMLGRTPAIDVVALSELP